MVVTSFRVRVDTRNGPITGWVNQVDDRFVGLIDRSEYPDLPAHAPLPGEPLAKSVDEAVAQPRRAVDRS